MKKILITGASSGIGKELCLYFLKNGYKVVGLSRSKVNINDESFKHYCIDLSENFQKLSEIITESVNNEKYDFMIHCAGMEQTLPIKLQNPEVIQKIFSINVFSSIELVRLFSSKKISNNNSSILLFSSIMGLLGQKGKVGYCSTKAAVLGLVKASALELAPRKIKVNAILPGVVRTEMTEKLFNLLGEKEMDSIIKMHPLGIGNIDDLIPLINTLTLNNSWITGQNFIIDGGYSIQ